MRRSGLSAVVMGGVVLLALSASRGEPLVIGAAMPSENVRMANVVGGMMTLADVKGKAGTLVIFSCNHCPFVKAWQDRMVQIANDGMKKGVGAIFVNSNDPGAIPEDDLAHMKKQAEEKGYAFPYVVDEKSDVARAFGASRTPEAFLFNSDGKLVYHGAYQSTDIMQVVREGRSEEFLFLHDRQAPQRFEYEIS